MPQDTFLLVLTQFFCLVFQQQFNMFILCMRQDYADKRKAFRQIIDVHKTELEEKERYWNEMLTVSFNP